MKPDHKDSENEHPNNPPGCWDIYINYVLFALGPALSIITMIVQLIPQFSSFEYPESIGTDQITLISLFSISLIGYFICMIYPFLNVLKYIFEEISDKLSFVKSLTKVTRAQWFLLLFHLTIMFSREFAATNIICLSLVFFNLMVDLFNSIQHFKHNNIDYLEYFSLILCLFALPFTSNVMTGVLFLIIKLAILATMKRTRLFLKNLEDGKSLKMLKIISFLSIINAYLFCFVFIGSYSNLMSVGENHTMFAMLGKIFQMLFASNVTKIVTWFM